MNRNQNVKSSQDTKSNSWRDEFSQEKQHYNRNDKTGAYSHRDSSQNDRFIKNETTYNRSGRERSYNKYDKSENTFNRGSRETSRNNNGNKFNDHERRYNRNNFDKAYNDKDLDTSFKSNDRRGRNNFDRDSFTNGREESYDSEVSSSRPQTGKWNNKKPAMTHKSNYKNGKFTGIQHLNILLIILYISV